MFDITSLDPSSVLTAFFALPRWAQIALLVMAGGLVLMNSILSTVLWSRRKALLKVEELTVELADVRARLSSETRWRLADERYTTGSQTTAGAANDHVSAIPAI